MLERKNYRRRMIRYITGAETSGRPCCYSRSVSRVLLTRPAVRSPSPIFVPEEDLAHRESGSDDEADSRPQSGPQILRWAATFNPQILTTTTSSSYAPGAVGLEGYESSHQLLRCDPGLTGAFVRGINSHLRVPVGDLDSTLEALSHNLHSSGGASSMPHRPLSSSYWDIPSNLSPLLGPQSLAPEGLGHGSWKVTPIDRQVKAAHRLASNGLKYMLEASTIAQTAIPPGDEHVIPPGDLRLMMGNLREALCATAATLGELVHPYLAQQRTATLKSSPVSDRERFLQEPYVPGSILGPSAQALWKNGPDFHYEASRLMQQLAQPRRQQSRSRGRGVRGPSNRSNRPGPYQSRQQQQNHPRSSSPGRRGRGSHGGAPKRGGGQAPKKRF